MKKLSTEEKAKRYDEAIKIAKEINNEKCAQPFNVMTRVFPELQESEDDRIIRCLLNYFHHVRYNGLDLKDTDVEEVIVWLEKQGKQKSRSESAPEVIKELKYKDGDWIVYDNNVYKIVNIPHDNYYECLGIDNTIRVYDSCIDDKSHLWTIKDAKEGDVLVLNGSKCIALFKNIYDEESFRSHGFVGHRTGTFDSCPGYHDIEGAHPATKEQHELLFRKMKKAGYGWDKDKKGLKKL